MGRAKNRRDLTVLTISDSSQGPPPAADALAARRRRRRLPRVRFLRRALPVFAALLLLACLVQITARVLAARSARTTAAVGPTMLEPRFTGTSARGVFSIAGRTGARPDAEDPAIIISEPEVTFRDEDGGIQKATARTAAYDESARTLLLTGDVRMDDGAGGILTTEQALIDTQTTAVHGDKRVRIERDGDPIEAGSFTLDGETDRVILKGGVRGRITRGD